MQTETLAGSATITVSVAPSEVYAYLTDITHLADLSPECIRCEWSDSTVAGRGAVFIGTNEAHGQQWSTICEVVTSDAPSRFVFDSGGPDHKFTRWSYEIAADGAGGSLVTESFELLDIAPHLAAAGVEGRQMRVAELEDGIRQTLVRLREQLQVSDSVVTRASDSTPLWFGDALFTVKAKASERGFALAEMVLPPGAGAPLHAHDVDDTFYVLEGQVSLWCEGRVERARAGDYVVLPAGAAHSLRVEGDQPLRALVIHADDEFMHFVEELGTPQRESAQPTPIEYTLVVAAAARHHQTLLGPSPFETVTA